MEREQFIKSLGLRLAAACAASSFTACSKSTAAKRDPAPTTPPQDALASFDLSTNIPNVGDQIVKNSVLVYRIAAGSLPGAFVATEAFCPHQGGTLNWLPTSGFVQCQLHRAQYKQDGSIIQGPQGIVGSTRQLKIYTVTVSGSTLKVS